MICVFSALNNALWCFHSAKLPCLGKIWLSSEVQTYLTNQIAGFFKPYGSLGSAGKKI